MQKFYIQRWDQKSKKKSYTNQIRSISYCTTFFGGFLSPSQPSNALVQKLAELFKTNDRNHKKWVLFIKLIIGSLC